MSGKGFGNFSKNFNNFASQMKGGNSSRTILSLLLLGGLLSVGTSCFYYGIQRNYCLVEVGHYAIKFNRLWGGLGKERYREGYNLKWPFIEEPIIYNVQTREN